jgi:hypothetical protein
MELSPVLDVTAAIDVSTSLIRTRHLAVGTPTSGIDVEGDIRSTAQTVCR